MSQNQIVLPTTGTVSGLTMTQDTNAALDTLNTKWSGSSAPSSPEQYQDWLDTSTSPPTLRIYDGSQWVAVAQIDTTNHKIVPQGCVIGPSSSTDGNVAQMSGTTGEAIKDSGVALSSVMPAGQCQLQYVSSTQIKLVPYGGNGIRIDGVTYPIPSAGITARTTGVYVEGVANQSLAANTQYYVYAFNNSGTLTLDFWPTSSGGHLTDGTAGNVGVEVRSNSGTPDSTRTLVGGVGTDGSIHFNDSLTNRSVLSWFNRRQKPLNGASISATTTAAGMTKLTTSANELVCMAWSTDMIELAFIGSSGSNTQGAASGTQLGIGGFTTGSSTSNWSGVANAANDASITHRLQSPSDIGSNVIDLFGQSNGTATATFTGVLEAYIWG